jgi:hypothetical protein
MECYFAFEYVLGNSRKFSLVLLFIFNVCKWHRNISETKLVFILLVFE